MVFIWTALVYVTPNPDPNTGREGTVRTKNTKIVNKRLYTIKEMTIELGATEWFWRSQIWAGRLPFVQVGRKILVDRRDIEIFIEKHKICH